MKSYTARLSHHSIARSPLYTFRAEDLKEAKRLASKRFRGRFNDHRILLYETDAAPWDECWSRSARGGRWKRGCLD